MLLANPHWNITLSDFGYSDFLLDNTPGFEGREYLSGEWGAAIGYTKDGVAVPPTWLDPNFLYPDWQSNSNFQVVQGIHLVGANLDGLPIAESIIANSDLEITLRFEMVDTVVGTPMGTTPASAGSAATSIDSNRYVLNQSFKVRNISGAAITNVQLFQFLHGLNAQHGVYDNRAYAGKLSQYRYDATLAGIDAGAVGAGSSSRGAGGLSSPSTRRSRPPRLKSATTASKATAWTITRSASRRTACIFPSRTTGRARLMPRARAATASRRRTAGSQADSAGRWATSPADSPRIFDIVLSLLTGTKVTTGGGGGNHTGGSCNGGSSHVGGVDFEFDDATSAGTFFGEFSEADDSEMTERENEGQFALPTFPLPDGSTVTQLWNLDYSGTHNGLIHLTFAYDPALLPAGFDETRLAIYHYHGAAWEKLTGAVDTVAHTITVTTTSLSPFALGISTFNIDASVSAGGGGTITGAGAYATGASVTLTATPDAGYKFVNWTENGTAVSASPSYSFVVERRSHRGCELHADHTAARDARLRRRNRDARMARGLAGLAVGGKHGPRDVEALHPHRHQRRRAEYRHRAHLRREYLLPPRASVITGGHLTIARPLACNVARGKIGSPSCNTSKNTSPAAKPCAMSSSGWPMASPFPLRSRPAFPGPSPRRISS